MNKKARIIAFYLPQFHPISENDEWWGKGFTEWTNVGKAKPLFKGHYQPKVPADLGYYDLRIPQVRQQQVELAKEAGVHGFCYWHYWFGDGKQLMANIFDEVLATGKPDFPFCLGWANHSWYAKTWSAEGVNLSKLLIEQRYPGEDDIRQHCDYLFRAFRDERYIKINGKPLFAVFDAINLPRHYINRMQERSREAGFADGIYLVAVCPKNIHVEKYLEMGYSAVTYQRMTNAGPWRTGRIKTRIFKLKDWFNRIFRNYPPFAEEYKNAALIDPAVDSRHNVIPTILPNWDHTPRSGKNGTLLLHSTPALFKRQASLALQAIANKPDELKIMFLKSWNEWAEGNYMEPCLKFGKGYINALREALEEN